MSERTLELKENWLCHLLSDHNIVSVAKFMMLFREHCTALSVDNQLMLMDALKKASEELDSVGRNRPGPGPPPLFQVRGVSTLKPELRPIPVILNPQTANGPFLFKPAARKRDDEEEQEKIQWVIMQCSTRKHVV